MIIILFTALHFTMNFDSFIYYTHGSGQTGIYVSPVLNIKARYRLLSFFGTGGYAYSGYVRSKSMKIEENEWKLYQLYGKLYYKGFELKGGKSVYIPGFPGLFNPFSRKKIFNTITSQLEGDWGGLLRYSKRNLTSSIFLYRCNNRWEEEGEFQLDYGRFLIGLFARNGEELHKGIFGAYLGPLTLRLSFLQSDNSNSFLASLDKDLGEELLTIHFLRSDAKFPIYLPTEIFYSDMIVALELNFPNQIFEIPYILYIYDITNKNSIMLFDTKVILRNYLKIEAGMTVHTKPKLSATAYAGLQFLWGF